MYVCVWVSSAKPHSEVETEPEDAAAEPSLEASPAKVKAGFTVAVTPAHVSVWPTVLKGDPPVGEEDQSHSTRRRIQVSADI